MTRVLHTGGGFYAVYVGTTVKTAQRVGTARLMASNEWLAIDNDGVRLGRHSSQEEACAVLALPIAELLK